MHFDRPIWCCRVRGGVGNGGGGSAAVGSGEPLSQQIIADEDAVFGLDGEPLGLNVLFVDDQAIIRRLGDVFLRQLGCSVEVHEDGDEIVAALLQPRDKPFDAIVMDIVMRRSDGGEVCRVLREKHDVQLPIIAISSYASRKTLSAFYRDGFDVVLEKPFSREALGRALLEGRARRSALMRSRRLHTTPPELKSGTGSNGGACA